MTSVASTTTVAEPRPRRDVRSPRSRSSARRPRSASRSQACLAPSPAARGDMAIHSSSRSSVRCRRVSCFAFDVEALLLLRPATTSSSPPARCRLRGRAPGSSPRHGRGSRSPAAGTRRRRASRRRRSRGQAQCVPSPSARASRDPQALAASMSKAARPRLSWPRRASRCSSTPAGRGSRDADRIAAAAADAGVTAIDYLVATHSPHRPRWEAPRSSRSGCRHGPSSTTVRPWTRASAAGRVRRPRRPARRKRHVVAPDDRVPMDGVEVVTLASGGAVLDTPLARGGRREPRSARAPRSTARHHEPLRERGGRSVGQRCRHVRPLPRGRHGRPHLEHPLRVLTVPRPGLFGVNYFCRSRVASFENATRLPQKDRTGVSGRTARLQGRRPGRSAGIPPVETHRTRRCVVQVDSGSVRVVLAPCVLRDRRPDRSFWSVVGFFRLRFPTTIEAVGACAKPRPARFRKLLWARSLASTGAAASTAAALPACLRKTVPASPVEEPDFRPSARAFDGITSVETDRGRRCVVRVAFGYVRVDRAPGVTRDRRPETVLG